MMGELRRIGFTGLVAFEYEKEGDINEDVRRPNRLCSQTRLIFDPELTLFPRDSRIDSVRMETPIHPGENMRAIARNVCSCRSLGVLIALTAVVCPAAEDRVKARVDANRTVVLERHLRPEVQSASDLGPVDPDMPMGSMTLVLRPAAQVTSFLAEQQNPASPNYHRWLTPEQFGERFGLSSRDLSTVVSWLEAQGFQVGTVARGRHWLQFSGTAGQASRAFRTSIHRYRVNGESHFANTANPAIPEALSSVVASVRGLHDFLPTSYLVDSGPKPNATVGSSHYLAPDDFATIYNLKPLYNAGIDGSGQTIVIIGASAPPLTDLRNFRKLYNLPAAEPVVVAVNTPSTGAAEEAALDLEWASAIARNAKIVYVYSGGITDAIQYAVDQNLGTVMSLSFGWCELWESPETVWGAAQQANAQGITFLASSGDSGPAQCDRGAPTPQAAKGPTVSSPASLPEVTAVGGTQFDEGTGNYWQTRNDANGASALSYIPERAWNEALLQNGLWSTGGGPSSLIPKPAWQTGPGVPNDGVRDVPDVSLSAAGSHDGYQIIYLGSNRVVGGTSASAPAFAGIVALLNQYLLKNNAIPQPGLGNINPMLYRLAQSTTDVFHDTIAGDNHVLCAQGTPGCRLRRTRVCGPGRLRYGDRIGFGGRL